MDNFVTKDSGERKVFAGGMVRDVETGKADYTNLFHGPMADRWAELMTRGRAKYPDTQQGTPNWMEASGHEELERFQRSAMRHMRQWLRGDRDEDHAAAVFFNLNSYEYLRDKLAKEDTVT